MEYLANKTTNESFEMLYTEEKKRALQRVLTSQSAVVSRSISDLKELGDYLDTKFTMDDLPMRTSLQRIIGNLRYEKDVIDSFKEALSK